jgi:hypothetical protein
LKQEISYAIEGATASSGIQVRIAEPGEEFGGDDPRNVVNRLTAGGANGIQIESPSRLARTTGAPSPTRSRTSTAPKLPVRLTSGASTS